MRLRLLLAALSSMLLTSAGHADTIKVFQFTSDLTGGYTAQGTIDVDTTAGLVEQSQFSLSQGGTLDATFTNPDLQEIYDGDFLAEFQGSTSGYTYELLLPGQSLVGYAGGSTCTESAPCNGLPSGVFLPGGQAQGATDGTLTAVTPEPASILLLATGLVGVFAIAKRRHAKGLDDPEAGRS